MNFDQYFKSDENHECASCLDTLSEENFVLYKDNEQSDWKPCQYCSTCIKHMLKTKWENYVQAVDKADCVAELRRLLDKGPPINFRDPSIKCDNERSEVHKFYYSGCEQSAKLEGSLVDEEREKWLADQKETLSMINKVSDKENS